MVYKIKSGDSIYLPMAPAQWLDNSFKRVNCMLVLMSCGGGMGGSSWYEFIKPTDFNDGLIEVEGIHGDKFFLNTDFIVKVSWCDFIMVDYYTTNPNFGEHSKTLEFVVDEGMNINLSTDIELLDKYTIKL